jgi:hypothetical protein
MKGTSKNDHLNKTTVTIYYRMISEMNTIPTESTLVEGGQEDEVGGELGDLGGHKGAEKVEIPGIPEWPLPEIRRSKEHLRNTGAKLRYKTIKNAIYLV